MAVSVVAEYEVTMEIVAHVMNISLSLFAAK